MYKVYLGAILGILLTSGLIAWSRIPQLGATPSNGNFLGIYNATPTDLGLRDGEGSAFLTDNAGRVVVTSTH